jgi:hypothetical protein
MAELLDHGPLNPRLGARNPPEQLGLLWMMNGIPLISVHSSRMCADQRGALPCGERLC